MRGSNPPQDCTVCGVRPVAGSYPRRTKFCHGCMPGGPFVPPPCRRCGRTDGYYSAGLCDQCHRSAPQPAAACRDCHAWGVGRIHQWLCDACRHWRKKHPQGKCRVCSADAAVNNDQACRLCWSQFNASGGRKSGADLLEANRYGQQLFLANLRHASVGQLRGTRRLRQKHNVADRITAYTAVTHRQLVLFPATRGLANGRTHGFPAPADPGMAAFMDHVLIEHAREHGWSPSAVKKAAVLRDALNSPDPARAAVTAIVAFHGLRSGQLRKLQLTDIHDGRLHLNDRTIPLAQPVRDRLSAWLAYREERWPWTRNPHVFVSRRTALDTAPVGVWWITTSMGMTAQEAREDRILHELHASGGDIRRLCDMFGLSIAGASRYSSVLGAVGPGLSGTLVTTPRQIVRPPR